jgi:excisionase family DNA binding protein
MSKELTAVQAAERLGVGRSTVNLWCRQGRFPRAHIEESPLGSYWLIPETDLNRFEKPERGRPRKAQTEKTSKKGKREK